MKHLLISAVLSVGLATSAVATTLSDQFSAITIFGDSLSDNGNLFGTTLGTTPPSPYFAGRFSNGPVWNEAIATELSGGTNNPALLQPATGSVNLAFGGARADNDTNANGPLPSLQTQLGIFLGSGGTFDADELVSVWAGANDIFQDLPTGVPFDVGENAANDVGGFIGGLATLGAKNVLVFNLPDFGVTPRYALDPLQAAASEAIETYNATLNASLDAFEILNPDVDVFRVDVFSIFNDIIADPAAFGFADVSSPCIVTLACILADKAVQDTFLFWDEVHPTQGGHRLIEAAARQALAPVPLPAGAPLYLLALTGFGLVARRRS